MTCVIWTDCPYCNDDHLNLGIEIYPGQTILVTFPTCKREVRASLGKLIVEKLSPEEEKNRNSEREMLRKLKNKYEE
jgi:hypothetical protein